ncbi:5'-nucleotidase [Aequitasia blattaphilus]|uniref:5'-nucleotidase n=1 Tax=Aequitasia blattaphilus TaxID=2949332 RepID=A0ABT1E6D6_9FIRM|nr:5'/3'-nucleotidase SurE [Aequitasia blattaphilus]MCP1101398.1 5'/3'-nucleotidase SurE [Aequitasia blattaphilus]MCR8614038.1 5'/3'-nucleotidase SurE [Aequitasia blattaphilus]
MELQNTPTPYSNKCIKFSNRKPRILITNDDGILSPGIQAAAEAVADLGELLIIAPDRQQTAMGRSFPRQANQGIIKEVALTLNGKKRVAYSIIGSPAYAVAHGVLEMTKRKPDLCISGINYGENLGLLLTCSGTLGAAMEANSHRIPALAFSREAEVSQHLLSDYPKLSWEKEKSVVRFWTEKVLKEGMIKESSILNINIPREIQAKEDFRITRQASENYFEFIPPNKRDLDTPYELKSQRIIPENRLNKNSDIYVFAIENKISVTPLTWDFSI